MSDARINRFANFGRELIERGIGCDRVQFIEEFR